jgi:hypothetical protein
VLVDSVLSCRAALRALLQTRGDSALEILALRQQLAVLKRKRPRPQLNRLDRIFWTALRRCWSGWSEVLIIVKPETVVGWHRAGFRLYWRWRSRIAWQKRPNDASSHNLGRFPQRMHSGSLGSGSARIRVPRESSGAEKENHMMCDSNHRLAAF